MLKTNPSIIIFIFFLISIIINFYNTKAILSNIILLIIGLMSINNIDCLILGKCYIYAYFHAILYSGSIIGYIYYQYFNQQENSTKKYKKLKYYFNPINLPNIKL